MQKPLCFFDISHLYYSNYKVKSCSEFTMFQMVGVIERVPPNEISELNELSRLHGQTLLRALGARVTCPPPPVFFGSVEKVARAPSVF